MCKTDRGCPIEDIASDYVLNKQIESFIDYKVLSKTGAPETLCLEALERCGLRNDPEGLTQSELVYAKYVNLTREKEKRHGSRHRR